jgi:hypothetical protein
LTDSRENESGINLIIIKLTDEHNSNNLEKCTIATNADRTGKGVVESRCSAQGVSGWTGGSPRRGCGMKWSRIELAKVEACRFLELVNRLQKLSERDKEDALYGGVLSGKIRRSSLDLTRCLAEMRKP